MKTGIMQRASNFVTRETAKASVRLHQMLRSQRGQGTTEYAILVGVLVVIAIIAIVVFRPKLQELWDSIASNMETL